MHEASDSLTIALSFTGAMVAFVGWWVWFIVSERRYLKKNKK